MIASQNSILEHNFKACELYQEDCLDDSASAQVIRKFINPAIYVEKTLDVMQTHRQNSATFNNQYIDNSVRIYKTKRCSCATNPRNCSCHQFSLEEISKSSSGESVSSNSACCSKTDIENSSRTSTKTGSPKELKLALSPLSSSRPSSTAVSEEEKQNVIRNWIAKKDQEKKKRQLAEAKLKEQKEKERQEMLEKERENFKKWLANKKREEEKKRRQKEIEIEEQKLKEAEKEKRQLENQLHYQLWLKKKEEQWLDNKIKEEINIIKQAEERERRMAENERAFQEWCKISKYKPKPVPMNQGLESLKSSISVSYINPIPWNSEIDVKTKPSSQ